MTRCIGYPKACTAHVSGRPYCSDCWRAKRANESGLNRTILAAWPKVTVGEDSSSRKELSKVFNKATIVREVLLTWGRDCHLCGGPIEPEELSFDHLIPRSKGGLTNVNNLRAAHKSCNQKRGNDPLTVAA